jgi:hypothetical protein
MSGVTSANAMDLVIIIREQTRSHCPSLQHHASSIPASCQTRLWLTVNEQSSTVKTALVTQRYRKRLRKHQVNGISNLHRGCHNRPGLIRVAFLLHSKLQFRSRACKYRKKSASRGAEGQSRDSQQLWLRNLSDLGSAASRASACLIGGSVRRTFNLFWDYRHLSDGIGIAYHSQYLGDIILNWAVTKVRLKVLYASPAPIVPMLVNAPTAVPLHMCCAIGGFHLER